MIGKKNNTFQVWLKASRLRTLPLAVGGILLGGFLAAYEFYFSWPIFALCLVTAILLQILSNFANDYGDFIKGTDTNSQRTDRALASGSISLKSMKNALWLVGSLTLLCGITLLVLVFKALNFSFLIWFILGCAAIAAALKYTVGKNAYGYAGLGDLFVLFFFGPVSVCGTYFLMSKQLPNNIWVPGLAFGLLCVAVLNINNLRDIKGDSEAGKKTMVVRLGYKKGIWYQYVLVGAACILLFLFSGLTHSNLDQYLVLLFALIYYFISFRLSDERDKRDTYNAALKQFSISNLLFVILLGILWLN